jgi:hypothetical protein
VIRNEDKKKIISYLRGDGAKAIVWKNSSKHQRKDVVGIMIYMNIYSTQK